MSVVEETPIASSLANGVTTLFPHLFTVLDADDLVVQGTIGGVTTPYTLGVDYSVNGVGASTGSVQFVSPPASGTTVTRYRDTALARETDYQNNGDLLARTVNLDFDRLWLALQDIFNGGKAPPTTLRVPDGEAIDPLPEASLRANRLVAFDSLGQPTVSAPASGTAAAVLADLINTDTAALGDALLGVKLTDTGAVATTQHQVNQERVSVFRFMTAAQIADAVNGTALTTNPTAAIQAALAALTVRGGGVLRFPAGLYRAVFPVVTEYTSLFKLTSNVAIEFDEGARMTCSAVTGSLLFAALFGVDKTALPVTNIAFRNLRLTSDAAGGGEELASAIQMDLAPDAAADRIVGVTIENCEFNDFASAVYVIHRSSAGSLTRQVRDVKIRNCRGDGNFSFITADGSDILIDGNRASGDAASPGSTYDAVTIHSGRHVRVVGNHFANYGDFGVQVRNSSNNLCGSDNITIAGNTFDNCEKGVGVVLVAGETTYGVRNVAINGNAFSIDSTSANTAVGIYCDVGAAGGGTPFEGVAIGDNTIYNYNSGIDVAGTAGIRLLNLAITGNRVYCRTTNTGRAFGLNYVDLSTISGNTFNGENTGASYEANQITNLRYSSVSGNNFYSGSAYAVTHQFGDFTSVAFNGNQVYGGFDFATLNSSTIIAGNRWNGAGTVDARTFNGPWDMSHTRTTHYDTAAPVAGTWFVGDRVQKSNPAVGQPKAWICTVAGTPGTWTSEGNL